MNVAHRVVFHAIYIAAVTSNFMRTENHSWESWVIGLIACMLGILAIEYFFIQIKKPYQNF